MDWIKNNHPQVITAAVFCLGFVVFLYASFTTFVSYDAFWHLKMGQDFLYNGLSPRIDHYSYTFAGMPIKSIPYFFQIFLATMISIFGEATGFQLTRLVAVCLLLGVLYLFYREIRAPWPIALITLPYIYVFLLYRFDHIRPEIFDYSLIVAAMVLYLKASKSFSQRNLIYICVLQFIWVNYHASIIGYVIFFGLFLDKAIALITRKDNSISWQRWAAWGAILFTIGFLNLELQHPLFAMLSVTEDWGAITGELRATHELVPDSSLFTFFWLVSAYLVIVLIVQRQYGLALLCGIFAYKAWGTVGLVGISGMVVFSLLAFSLSTTEFHTILQQLRPVIRKLTSALGIVMAISGILLAIEKSDAIYDKANIDDRPVDVASYLRDTYPSGGKIFNRMRDGGYLIHRLSPEFKVHIDGRTNILYSFDFTSRWVNLYASQHVDSVASEIRRYNADFAIFPLAKGQFPVIDRSNPLTVEYFSKYFVLMSAQGNNFPLSSRILYFPMCWERDLQSALSTELAKARQILPDDAAIIPLLTSLASLEESTNLEQFFAAELSREPVSHYHARLLAYVALEFEFYESAIEFFKTIERKQTLDLLIMSYAALNHQDYKDSEWLVQAAMSDAWAELNDKQLDPREQAIALTLLESIKQHRVLTPENERHRQALHRHLKQTQPSLKLPLDSVIPRSYCPALLAEAVQKPN